MYTHPADLSDIRLPKFNMHLCFFSWTSYVCISVMGSRTYVWEKLGISGTKFSSGYPTWGLENQKRYFIFLIQFGIILLFFLGYSPPQEESERSDAMKPWILPGTCTDYKLGRFPPTPLFMM